MDENGNAIPGFVAQALVLRQEHVNALRRIGDDYDVLGTVVNQKKAWTKGAMTAGYYE